MGKSKIKSKSKPKRIVGAEEENEAWPYEGPCLMIIHLNKRSTKWLLTLYDISRHRHHSRVPEITYDKPVFSGAHGHSLIIRDLSNRPNCCILNCVTMETQPLPPMEYEERMCNESHFLLHDRTVILMLSNRKILSCQIGANEFTRQTVTEGRDDAGLLDAIIFQGRLYYMTYGSYNLICSEALDDLRFREAIPGEKLKDVLVFSGYYFPPLIQSGDQLLFVDAHGVGMGAVDFRILRADLSGKGWEKLYSIGDDRAIFVDRFGSFSAALQAGCDGVRGNCIYYSHTDEGFSDGNTTLHAYDLKDESDTVLPPYPFRIHSPPPSLRWLNICKSQESKIHSEIV